MIPDKQKEYKFKCNCCYSKPGNYFIPCTCFYCKECFKGINFNKPECKVCKKQFDIKNTLDMANPAHVKSAEYLLDDCEAIFRRAIESYKVNSNK